ncbi:MAG TPA: hypothetical protein VGE39_06235 [Prosthecobacter sp.]
MIWRVAAVLAVVFWTVMSGLLLRDVYFPEASRFALVPPKVVLELFLRQSDAFGSTLHLYKHKEKIGHASFQISRRTRSDDAVAYDVLARGVVEETVPEKNAQRTLATWNVSCVLADAERWHHLAVAANIPQHDVSLKIDWNDGQTVPEVLVKQQGRVVVGTQDVAMLMKLGAGTDGAMAMLSMLGGGAGQAAKTPVKPEETRLQAREGILVLAGRERKCYVLTLPVLGQQEVKMIFTEAGELARIDLPDGYALLEPLIHGLQEGRIE